MTERGRDSLSRSRSVLVLHRSSLSLESDHLALSIDEIGTPIPRRIKGKVRLYPHFAGRQAYAIDHAGRHLWRPIAPSARVEVEMTSPSLRWSGQGYFDHNRGEAPLDDDFSSWTWTRLSLPEGSAIFYDTLTRSGDNVSLALRYDASGELSRSEPPPMVDMPPTGWRIRRSVRSESKAATKIRTLEDTPFYARSAVTTSIFGERADGMHETLSLDRFRTPVVQWMLPFRMPRRP